MQHNRSLLPILPALSRVAIGAIGRFLVALGDALADLVDGGVLSRRMELNHYAVLLRIAEIHLGGYVVIGTPDTGITLAVGDEVLVFGKRTCCRATLESVEISDRAVPEMTGDGVTEVGLRLSRRVPAPAELRRLQVPAEAPPEIQLQLDDAMPPMTDVAETDLPESTESESLEESGDSDQVVGPDKTPPAAT